MANMFLNNLIAVTTIALLSLGFPYQTPRDFSVPLAEHIMPLSDRQPDPYVNNVFKDNILLNLAYMDGKVQNSNQINWSEITKTQSYAFTLKPGQTFAFQDDALDKYSGKITKTTNAHFNYSDGFKSDGYLAGDGVCHLASLIYWTAKDAHLDAEAPTNHNFAVIPDVPREYGVAIFSMPGNHSANAQENLYVTNNRQKEVAFNFSYQNDNLKLTVVEIN